MIKLLVYGSLRQGMPLLEAFKRKRHKIIIVKENIKIGGYKMYDMMHYYPIILESEYTEDYIICDIIKIDQDTYQTIRLIELSSGYIEKQKHEDLIIFEYNPKNYLSSHCELIKDGDWIKYFNNLQHKTKYLYNY